jgi:flagellar basal-body rod protein FlgB
MAINFDTALGVHPQALVLREKRSEVLAANLANADTPGYKARDMDFQAVLDGTMKGIDSGLTLEKTHPQHIAPTQPKFEGTLRYRNPNQASLDGNTVEAHVEQAKYAENGVQYQASLRFINGKFGGLISAIKGE